MLLKKILGHPYRHNFEGAVHWKMLANHPIPIDDVTNVKHMFGPDLAGMRGKTEQL